VGISSAITYLLLQQKLNGMVPSVRKTSKVYGGLHADAMTGGAAASCWSKETHGEVYRCAPAS